MILNQNSLVEKYFEKICSIPHESKNEKALSDYIVSEAIRLGYDYKQDELYNVIVTIPATPGNTKEAIMISGHMDMVATKTKDKVFNFDIDPIELVLEGNILKANGTTLGADDGVATAYMLALMNDTFDHPLIECIFTVQEENGCIGSRYVDISNLVSKRLIGLDSTGEHEVTVGNYCSDLITFTKDIHYIEEKKKAYQIQLKEIDAYYVSDHLYDYHYNGIQYLAHILKELDGNLVSINGGKAENFPPQTCNAIFITDEDLSQINEITFEEVEVEQYLSKEDTLSIFNFLLDIPNGALNYQELLLESFLLGKVTTNNNTITVIGSSRCQNDDYNQNVLAVLSKLANQYLFTLETSTRYRSWKYIPYSPIRECYRGIIQERMNKELVETICPGGLEISDFLYKNPDLDVLAIGPLAGNFHTPDEWLNIDSFNLMYNILKELINK